MRPLRLLLAAVLPQPPAPASRPRSWPRPPPSAWRAPRAASVGWRASASSPSRSGRAPTSCLLHGNPASTYSGARCWSRLAGPPPGACHRPPGYGFSDKPADAPYDPKPGSRRVVVGYLDARASAAPCWSELDGRAGRHRDGDPLPRADGRLVLLGAPGYRRPSATVAALAPHAHLAVLGPLLAPAPGAGRVARRAHAGRSTTPTVSEADVDAYYTAAPAPRAAPTRSSPVSASRRRRTATRGSGPSRADARHHGRHRPASSRSRRHAAYHHRSTACHSIAPALRRGDRVADQRA